MESLTEALARIEGALAKLLGEVRELRRQVLALNDENQDLRDQLYRDFHRPTQGRGVSSLRDLYQEGFHICPSYFAVPLTAGMGCLHCLALLANAAEEVRDGNEPG